MAIQNRFVPTPAEKKLLEVLADPNSLGKSITDICTEAGVSRNVYYEAVKKPEFIDYLNDITKDIIKSNVSEIIKAMVKFGTTNAKNSQDRKMLLEMAGMYIQAPQVQNTITTLSAEEIEKQLAELEKKYKSE